MMQTANQNPELSTVAAPGVSPVRSALAYVALAFAFSWLLWVLVIKAHGREAMGTKFPEGLEERAPAIIGSILRVHADN
jgi:hypothetical protein